MINNNNNTWLRTFVRPSDYHPKTGYALIVCGISIFLLCIYTLCSIMYSSTTNATRVPTSGQLTQPSSSISPPRAESPAAAAAGYFTALSEQNADRALDFVLSRPNNARFLTSDVVHQQHKYAPVHNYEETNLETLSDTAVRIHYNVKLGQKNIAGSVIAVKYHNRWGLQNPFVATRVMTSPQADVPLEAFRQPVYRGQVIYTFPGSLIFTTSNPRIRAVYQQPAIVSSRNDQHEIPVVNVRYVLSNQGRKQLRTAIIANIKNCFESDKILHQGCGRFEGDLNETYRRITFAPLNEKSLLVNFLSVTNIHKYRMFYQFAIGAAYTNRYGEDYSVIFGIGEFIMADLADKDLHISLYSMQYYLPIPR